MISISRLGLGGLLALAISVAPAWGDQVFTDNTFNLADYSASTLYSSDPSASLVYASATNTLTFTAAFTQSSSTAYKVALGLANTTFSYDPHIQGAITSIDASVMKDLTVNYTGTATVGNDFRPMIVQDGTYYLAAIAGPGLANPPGSTGYNVIAQTGLTAADFLSYNFTTGTSGTANPNFSGDTLLLGLAQISSRTGSAATIVSSYQDLSFNLHTVPVPEPSSLVLGLSGALPLGVAFARRRRRSNVAV